MKSSITDALTNKARAKSKPYEIRDQKTAGFLLRVQPSGRKAYYCEYKRGGRLRIGDASVWTVKDARDRANVILVEFQKMGSINALKVQKHLTYLEFLERHYFPWVDANHKSAVKTRRRLMNDCKVFHKHKLIDISPQRVEKWRTERVAKGNSPHTANRCFAYLRASLSKAVEWSFLDDHPLRRMKLMKAPSNVKVRFLSQDEEKRLRRALEEREEEKKAFLPSSSANQYSDHLMPMVLLSMNTGVRRNELLSLRWNAVDLKERRITITATTSKSKKQRHIPLNDEAYRLLARWQSQNDFSVPFVFANKNGKPFVTVKTGWKALLMRAAIDDFRWHDLRHHFASRLAIAGVNLNTIRELLGHSSYAVTLRYAHLSENHKAAAVDLL